MAALGAEYRGGGKKQITIEKSARPSAGIPDKNLMGMPWRVAFALQDDGWTLRSDIIWQKPNPMPESVTDRPTRAHEYVFLFSKSRRYYYDALAIAEQSETKDESWRATSRRTQQAKIAPDRRDSNRLETGAMATFGNGVTRNARSVWTIATQPYSDAHFATMPVALADRCIRAGSSAQACETCGAAWVRVIEYGEPERIGGNAGVSIGHADGPMDRGGHGQWDEGHMPKVRPRETIGFAPRCACATNTGAHRSIVLDPFAGSGTTLRAAVALSRDAIGIDLAYQDMQERRTNGVQIELL